MKDVSRRNLIKGGAVALGAGAAVLTGAKPASAGEKIVWRMQALWGAGTTPQIYEEKFVKRVADLTDGNFEIKLFAGGQLVPNAQAFDAVRSGAFQMMKTFDGYAAGKIPAFGFTSTVPFGFPDPDQFEAWFYELGGLDMAREAYAPAGLTYIAPTVYGEEPIHSKVPLKSLADFKGKKGRFVGLASSVMGDMGVSVAPLPTSEVYSALDKGLIDLADRGDIKANFEQGLAEVAKYIILPGVHQPTTATSYVANTTAYGALPEQYKQALAVAAREISSSLRQNIMVSNVEYLQKFKDAGVEIITLDQDDIAQGRKTAVESWRKATKGNELATRVLETQMSYMRQLGLLA
ncbi:MAG: TRAP transporter substrate-binding protein DctP [Terasakiella sp.]|uniref:TRAP transporter substrate-binding protein DctP n=1 Tax=unclassified Terasakiella TaxID=2614952 RepID=UPI003B006654